MLREKNPYALIYKMMHRFLEEEYVRRQAVNLPHYTVGIIAFDRRNVDHRRYNFPTAHGIAVVFQSQLEHYQPTEKLAWPSLYSGQRQIIDRH